MLFATEDISRPTDWAIKDSRHALIVHLGGHMDALETELDGHGGSSGPAIKGEIWTVPAGMHYRSHARGGTISYAALYFDAPDRQIRAVAGKRDNSLLECASRLEQAFQTGCDTDELEAQALTDVIRNHFFERYTLEQTPVAQRNVPPLNSEQTRLLREFIVEMLSEEIILDDLAGLLKLTVHELLIAFRNAFGTTPAQYVIEQRVRAAQWKLLHTSADITSIALETGFSSHSHLTSAFQQRVGYSPTAFRSKFKT
jgi:AraC family transcriptional regulator